MKSKKGIRRVIVGCSHGGLAALEQIHRLDPEGKTYILSREDGLPYSPTSLVAFIGGGWLIIEFVHWILVDHYHFPEKSIDITFISLFGALISTIIWRLFRESEKKDRKFKRGLPIVMPLLEKRIKL